MSIYSETFRTELVNESVNKIYELAIREWEYTGDSVFEEGTCICGYPIRHQMIVVNKLTNRRIFVGNCCVRKFGIIKKSFNRSRENYLNYALSRAATEVDWLFVYGLYCRYKRFHSLHMDETGMKRLEAISGHPYRWPYKSMFRWAK